jgi:hypothetical protein
VGFFGGYVLDSRGWHGFDPDSDQIPDTAGPWLSVCIHDSDIAAIRYEPAGPGSGVAYLGFTPRTYFQKESASAPTDVPREAEGIAFWLVQQHGRSDEPDLRELIASFLAHDIREQQPGNNVSPADDVGDLDDADVFVEIKVARFLKAIELPVPAGLPGA